MKHVILFTALTICSASVFGQGSAQLLADQLDDLALIDTQPVEVAFKANQALIQAPTSTYMLEVINKKGLVVAQDPFNTVMSLNVEKWEPGVYTVLAHTFNGLKQVEFKVKEPAPRR